MSIRPAAAFLALIALGVTLSACHESDSAETSPTAPPPPPAATTGAAKVTITVPTSTPAPRVVQHAAAQSVGQHPVANSYVSPKTRSVTVVVTAVNGATLASPISASIDVAAGSSCTASAGGLTCTISIAAPIGNDAFTVSTFAQAGGLGQAISQGDANALVAATGSVDVPVTLLGVVSSLLVTVSPPGLPIGSAGVFTATIIGKDVNGDAITGSDNYYQPLTVSTTDLGAHVTASPALPATLASPAQNTIRFTYDGAGTASSYSFVVGGSGVQSTPVAYGFAATVEHLYVAYQFPAAVYVFDIQPDGTLTGPSRTIAGANTTLNRPTSIAVDDVGQLYVVNYGDFPSQGHDVAVFAPGATGNVAPIQTLLVGENPYYVSEQASAFLTHPNPTDASTSTVVINYSGSITLSPLAPSNLIPPFIEPFANGFASYQSSPSTTGYVCVTAVSPYDNGNGSVNCFTQPVLWVTGNLDPGTAQIVNGYARNALSCCGGGETDLKFLSDGQLVVSQGPTYQRAAQVDTYVIPGDVSQAPGIQPVLSISGSDTHLVSPTSMAVDSHGNLYVGDTGNASYNGSVHVFAPGASGNVLPSHELAGLNYPFGIAIGK